MTKYWSTSLLLLAIGGTATAGTLNFLNSPATAIDTVNWSSIGPDGTPFPDGQTVESGLNNLTTINLGTQPVLGGITSVVCAAVNPANCSWPAQPSGYNSGDTLIWLEGLDTNGNPVGTGPLTLSLQQSVGGLGLYIQSESAGAFSASLTAFNGASSLGTQSYTSDVAGDPLFLGVQDSVAEVSKVVVAVTACGGFACDPNDFSADTLQIYDTSPEPATFALGGALLALGFSVRKRFAGVR
ncbi:MAG TPA: hypothetical protein VFC21_06260 [Bryobacteraceae bacterium]|nr:hypothetical protein [Bryobacteraceae bacterium]